MPLIANYFGLSALDAAWWFLFAQVAVGVIVSGTALFSIAKTFSGKAFVVVGVSAVGIITWCISDVYVTYFFTVSFFPWILNFLEEKSSRILYAYSFIIGFVIGYGNFVRSFSGLPLLVGVSAAVICFCKFSRKTLLSLGLVMLGMGFVQLHIKNIIQYRNKYLNSQKYVFKKDNIHHAFWHSVYAGFGFITNNKNVDFSDTCSSRKVKKINPQAVYLSSEYELTLRNEVLTLCLNSPNYVLRVLFAKLGVLFYYLLLFANVGLIAAYYAPKSLCVEISYGIMLLVSALPGLLTIPTLPYLLGFVSIAALYGIHSIIYLLNTKYL